MTAESPPATPSASPDQASRILLASNRGPVTFEVRADGSLRANRGSGGVVTALASVGAGRQVTWVACAMNEGDRRAAEQGGTLDTRSPGIRARLVTLDREVYRKYYDGISNRVLWFLQHYMWDTVEGPSLDAHSYDAWETGYVPANEAIARAIVACAEEMAERPTVMVQDYHLYLVPELVRRLVPECALQHFTHIPWPEPRYWHLLPIDWLRAICHGLAACDIVGFQTRRDAANFLSCCAEVLGGATADFERSALRLDGRVVQVRAYPISVDPARLQRLADSPAARRHSERLAADGVRTIVRVDRLEPSKNLIRGFAAFEALLERRRDLRGKVRFLAFLVPSRENVPEYRRYRRAVAERVEAINRRYGDPIRVFYENNYPQAIGAMTHYDVLLVNPLIDGMNLVAKEGPIVNRRAGVLILSEGAGAHAQLGEAALSVAGADVEGTARALERALEMPEEERLARASRLRDAILREDIRWWLDRQLADLALVDGSAGRHPVRGQIVGRAGSAAV